MTGLTKRQWAAMLAAAAVTMVAGCSGDANAPQTTSGTVGEAPTTAAATSESEAAPTTSAAAEEDEPTTPAATEDAETTAPAGDTGGAAADGVAATMTGNSIALDGQVLAGEFTAECRPYLDGTMIEMAGSAEGYDSILFSADHTEDLTGGIVVMTAFNNGQSVLNGTAYGHTVAENAPNSTWLITATMSDVDTGQEYELAVTADCG